MNQTRMIAIALCILLLAAAGAGVAAAKQDENPHQAGKSSVYFYDVAAGDTHGKGRLMVDVDRHTFVFNGQDFAPSSQVALHARATGSADYAVFASGKATPSGNLHIAGTWEADTPPAVVGSYATLSYFDLYNTWGFFVAQIACYYSTDGGVTWHESDHSKDITIGNIGNAELGDLGVPDGALVKIHAIVVAGKDRTGSEVFQYSPYAQYFADYYITGTTWDPELTYNGIWGFYY